MNPFHPSSPSLLQKNCFLCRKHVTFETGFHLCVCLCKCAHAHSCTREKERENGACIQCVSDLCCLNVTAVSSILLCVPSPGPWCFIKAGGGGKMMDSVLLDILINFLTVLKTMACVLPSTAPPSCGPQFGSYGS